MERSQEQLLLDYQLKIRLNLTPTSDELKAYMQDVVRQSRRCIIKNSKKDLEL